jgi:thermitase
MLIHKPSIASRTITFRFFTVIISFFLITYLSFYLVALKSASAGNAQAGQIWKSSQTAQSYSSNEILVGFNKNISIKQAQGIVKSNKSTILGKIAALNIYQLKVKDNSKNEAKKYMGIKGVKFAEPNYRVDILSTPNDTLYAQQWAPIKTYAPAGWDTERGDTNPVPLAVVDTGVDKNHPDVNDKLLPGYDFYNNDSDPDDDNGHGTHVSAIAAAETNNSEGVAGISWGAKVMPVKVLNSSGSGTDLTVSKGIIYAADNGAKVINLSLGGGYSDTMKSAVDYAYNKGCVIVAAAGNSGNNSYLYPASFDNVISVAATDSNDLRASFSNYNDKVDVAAPGVSILSAVLNGGYQSWSGTSMASPHVAGLAALVLSKDPSLTNQQVDQLIKQTADDVNGQTYPGNDVYLGAGRINVSRALGNNSPPQPVPAIPTAVITSPSNGQTVNGIIGVDATITSQESGAVISYAEFKLDSGSPSPMLPKDGIFDLATEDTTAALDTESLVNGYHTIYVRGKDSNGNWSAWASVTVLVDNLNLIAQITYPDLSNSESVSGVINVQGTAKDNNQTQFLKYKLEYYKGPNNLITIIESSQPVENGLLGKWDAGNLAGMYKLRLTVYDTAGNQESVIKQVKIRKLR